MSINRLNFVLNQFNLKNFFSRLADSVVKKTSYDHHQGRDHLNDV